MQGAHYLMNFHEKTMHYEANVEKEILAKLSIHFVEKSYPGTQ